MPYSRALSYLVLLLLLQACTSAPPTVIVKEPATEIKVPLEDKKVTAQDFIQKAQASYLATGNIHVRNDWLLTAANAYLQQSDPKSCIKLLQLVVPELQDKPQQARAYLMLTKAYSQTEPVANVNDLYSLVSKINPKYLLDKEHRKDFYQLKLQTMLTSENWLAAADAAFYASDAPQNALFIWQLLIKLDRVTLEQANEEYPHLRSWLQLALTYHRYGLQSQALAEAVSDWQRRNSQHQLAQKLPSEITLAMQTSPIQASKIAVLIPLSGRLQLQGQAIKEGVLASYLAATQLNDTLIPEIRYLDTNILTTEELVEQTADADVIIGPLLKEKLLALLPKLPIDKPVVALNQLDQQTADPLNSEIYFFSLSPEEEAEQLARLVAKRGHKHPILVSTEGNIGERMFNAFSQQWKKLKSADSNQLILTTFASNADMREQLSLRLDVSQSQDRIDRIARLTNQEVHSVARNRQDVDAVVVFATPEQTQLLNPIVEASVSPFSETQIAVYASSRSHALNLSSNSLRDLKGVTFTDMPWMLPQMRDAQLHQETAVFWQGRPDAMLRLFALGYDAYQLLPVLRHMKLLPNSTVNTLSGELSVDEDGMVKRQLTLAKFNERQVETIAME